MTVEEFLQKHKIEYMKIHKLSEGVFREYEEMVNAVPCKCHTTCCPGWVIALKSEHMSECPNEYILDSIESCQGI